MQKVCFLVLTYNSGYGSKETVIQKVESLLALNHNQKSPREDWVIVHGKKKFKIFFEWEKGKVLFVFHLLQHA